ncbi:L,D-transpeptidase [Paracoccus suum]|uniref:L,D-transpeptidase n=1 Tax=Paracoccus suum TaxID=2259340 RepID=A0A344PGN2_9RHOB|nr:L,D-transpeptidase [Paracoccus suum]AXC48537.1 L,D-transpeptidase [Paracoccus suum]
MTDPVSIPVSRRRLLTSAAVGAGAAVIGFPALAQGFDPYTGAPLQGAPAAGATPDAGVVQVDPNADSRHNISSWRAHADWRPYFSNLTNGAILVDITSRALTFWSEDESVVKVYPTSVPVSSDLTRRGRTEIIKKVEGPTWAPTPEMKKRNPEWPDFVPAGPDNPLGTHALWLSWQYYRIHGTHDTRKIGRKSSNGCVGLYNEHIKELFGLTTIGTQVLLI